MSLQKFAELTATGPAKLFGLYPQKGAIAVGSDADLVIWDSEREVLLQNELLHHATDYTPYEGLVLRGWPSVTISRGEVVYADGKVLSKQGRGQFIARNRPFLPQQCLSSILAS